MNTSKLDIIEQAYLSLQQQLGKTIIWRKASRKNNEFDAVFNFEGKSMYVAAKNEVRPSQVESFLALRKQREHVLIVANYISPKAKNLLNKGALNYVDRAGNMLLRLGSIYIHIEKYPNSPSLPLKQNPFTKSGTKVIYHLLNDPLLIQSAYRKIAEIAEVSLGTIPKVISGLQEEGFLIKKTAKAWILLNHRELLIQWVDAYSRKLKPGLFFKRFRPTDSQFHTNWKNLPLTGGAQWGGEPAGDLIVQYLKPEMFTLYTNQSQQEIMTNYRWIPDQTGDIFIYRKFWKAGGERVSHTSPILTYADLLDTGNRRCFETANIIREQYLQEYS